MEIIAIANQKGGVGKTTTTINLGAELAAAGRRVLLIDMDSQYNTTTGLGVRLEEGDYSTYTVLHNPDRGIAYAVRTLAPGLDLLPASLDLAAAEWELAGQPARETLLRRALGHARTQRLYDVVLIDCPPSFTLLTQNGLTAADWVLVPVSAELYPVQGLTQLEKTVALIRDTLNPPLHIGGLLITMADTRNNLAQDVIGLLHKRFADRVYTTLIPRNVKLAEAPGAGQPIREYDPTSKGALAYAALAQEVLTRG